MTAPLGIDHTLIDPALETWMRNMGLQAYMRDKAKPAIRLEALEGTNDIVQALASFKFLTSTRLGWDELRRDVQTGGGADPLLLDQLVTGPRVLVVSVHVESIRADAPNHAFALAERLRTRLRLPTTDLLFKSAGIALNTTTDVIDISFENENGRIIGLAQFDLFVNAAAFEKDTATDTIGTVELTTDYKDVDGTSLPAEYQLDKKVLDLDNPP